MVKRYLILFNLFFIVSFRPLYGQVISRYNTFSYSVNEGLLQTTIGDIEIDANNFCWISFPNGIQKFDGNSFTNVPVQPGLPDDKYVGFFRCKNGDLLIRHSQGISKYNIAADNFSMIYKQPVSYQTPVVFIGEDSGILYFFDEGGTIHSITSTGYKQVSSFKTNLAVPFSSTDKRPRFSDNIINHKVAFRSGSTLYLLDLMEKKIINQSIIESLVFSFMLRLKNESEVLYYDNKIGNALQCWNFKTNSNSSLPVQGKDDKGFQRCVILPWQNKMLLSFNNRLFETDNTLQVLKSEFVNFQNQPVAGDLAIHGIKEDNFGNLYLQTVNGGIKKIIRNNYPVKYFGYTGSKDNNILAILPDKKNNRILTGGTGGLYVFDTLQQLIKHIKNVPGLNRTFSPTGIIQSGNGDYFIFIINSKTAWRLSKDLSALTTIAISSTLPDMKSYSQYFGNLIMNTGESAIFQTQQKLFRIDFSSNKISEHQFSDAYILGGGLFDNMIISHGNDELIFLDSQSFKELKRVPFKEAAGVRCFNKDLNGAIYAGTNKGIFKIDTGGKILQQWNKQTGLPDECIYALAFDAEGSIWCSTNKGILRIGKDNHVFHITKQDGLQENEFNTNVLAVAEDGEMYFGGTNGISSFYPSSISSFNDKISLLFTSVKANNHIIDSNTATWNISRIKLPYRNNSLSFDFVAMGDYNPGQYVYQYKMVGVDKQWVQNNGMQTVRYSLSPGRYVFQVYASRSFDKDAKPQKEIRIVIRSPFWKTWWFRTILGLFALSLLYYFVNEHIKRKYAKKIQQLENERQLKQERERISKDLHDSLGAYANAVLYNTELLEKEKLDERRNELIGDLKFASKDIITSLRETVWALKQETYTAEDCFVRIRNFIQPFAKYYSHINFRVEGDAPVNFEIHYTKALNLVRIMQEAISNSIKHADPKNITLSSLPVGNKWKLIIKDDGKGFDLVNIKNQERGNGLNNIEYRAAESAIELDIKTEEKKGTLFTLIV